jgi:ferredoxin
MPSKYHLETRPVPPRHPAPGATCILDWEEGCLKCARCVKWDCPYDAYRDRRLDPDTLADTIDRLCRNCLSCVQNCPNRLIAKTPNPEYRLMGDSYWTPEVLSQIYYQAETGLIPVSGAGYGGRFTGPGFDAMWTDMSEIVRPTRDGIHGREYISTAVDLGRKPERLAFDHQGGLLADVRPPIQSPLPFLIAAPPDWRFSRNLAAVFVRAARAMRALAVLPEPWVPASDPGDDAHIVPLLETGPETSLDPARFRMIAIQDRPELDRHWPTLRERCPEATIFVRRPFSGDDPARPVALARLGVDGLWLTADRHGLMPGHDPDRPFLSGMLRTVHLGLVEAGLRDEVTLLASGGLALAEHVAKSIICGADAVVLDLAVMAGLDCRLCPECLARAVCPVDVEETPLDWGAGRAINLCAAWRNQLLEVLGAMGLREVRRLRGEVGRAMRFEELERDIFGPVFGRRKEAGHV